jgi:hypothetical protein
MEPIKAGRFLALSLLALFFCAAIHAQSAAGEDAEGNIFIQQVNGTARIVQRLSWPGDENVSKYGLVVERQEGNRFREAYTGTTGKTYEELSLGPGNYRYRVSFYNLLNQIEHSTNWASFNIILALQPEITGTSPKRFLLYEDTNDKTAKWEILLRGENFMEGAVVYLEPLSEKKADENKTGEKKAGENKTGEKKAGEKKAGEKKAGGKFIKPLSYTPSSSGKEAALVFDIADLVIGDFRVYIRNPGKLEDSFEPFKIAMAKPIDFLVSASYTPLVPSQGYLFDELFAGFNPPGFQARLEFVPFKRTWGYLGAEGLVSWDYFSANKNNADISAHLLGFTVNALYKKWLPNYVMAINARLGLGYYSLMGLSFDFGNINLEYANSWFPSIDAGASFQWYIRKPFYLEFGIDCVYLFTSDTPRPGFFKPGIGAGWQF